MRVSSQNVSEPRTACSKNNFMGFHLGIITGKGHVKKVFFLPDVSECCTHITFKIIPPEAEFLRGCHYFINPTRSDFGYFCLLQIENINYMRMCKTRIKTLCFEPLSSNNQSQKFNFHAKKLLSIKLIKSKYKSFQTVLIMLN